jgi:formylmethanofuran dehydrogenase subunit E
MGHRGKVKCSACGQWVDWTAVVHEQGKPYCHICIKGADNIPSRKEVSIHDEKV